MTRAEFDLLLRTAGSVARETDFFLIGSQALRGVRDSIPRDFPKTFEADLYPRRHPQAWNILRTQMGKSSKFYRLHGYYLDCTDPGLATLPDGWIDRLIPYRNARTGGVTAWCLDPHDLFAAKLAAGREKDILFLRAMLRHRLARPALVRRRVADLALPATQRANLLVTLSALVKDRAKHQHR